MSPWWFALWVSCAPAGELEPWPAETEARARNLTQLEGGFQQDLSGAVWNPVTRTLWVCRNGPGTDSRLWVLEEDDSGTLRVASEDGRAGEWKGLGDCEGVTFANFGEERVFLLVEGEEKIRELDVSTHGKKSWKRVYDTSPWLPLAASEGAEGLTFVPDEHLARSGFVDSHGRARTSRGGLGGLMFVGHQNGGGLYAFDLDPETGAVEWVGTYRIMARDGAGRLVVTRVVGLEFDRSNDRLLVWHGSRERNVLAIARLSSRALERTSDRALETARVFAGPGDRGYEGIALVPPEAGDRGPGSLFLTVDDGGKRSLLRFRRFLPGPHTPR